MKPTPAILTLALALASCAPVVTTAAPTQLTRSASYTTAAPKAGEDNPVLVAIVSIAPTAPHEGTRQPWRAEEIERNSVALRSNPNSISTGSGFRLADYAQEMSFNVISAGGTTTVTAQYSSAYAATVSYIFTKLDGQFTRKP